MNEYVCVDQDNQPVKTVGNKGFFNRPQKPPDPQGDPWRFLEVVRQTGSPAFEGVEDGKYVIRTPPPPPRPTRTYTEFRARFNPSSELPALQAAVVADAQALDWALEAAADNEVNLDSPTTAAFLDKAVAAGVISAQRKAQIVDPEWEPNW